MDYVMDILIKGLLTACGAGVLTIIILTIKLTWKKFKADDLTIKALAHDAYFRHCHLLLQKDTITEGELENHDYLWRAYTGQGLNGTGQKLYEQILMKEVTTTEH